MESLLITFVSALFIGSFAWLLGLAIDILDLIFDIAGFIKDFTYYIALQAWEQFTSLLSALNNAFA